MTKKKVITKKKPVAKKPKSKTKAKRKAKPSDDDFTYVEEDYPDE